MTIEEIKKKMEYGDYNTLSKMLDESVTTVRARFLRKDPDTVEAMKTWVMHREAFVKSFRKTQDA